MKKLLAIILVLAMCLSLFACGSGSSETEAQETKAQETEAQGTEAQTGEEQVTITFMSNLADRTSAQGLIEQMLIDMYMEEHPNVTVNVETYASDGDYQTKFKAYVAAGTVPDICCTWMIPGWMDPLMEGGVWEPIDQDAIADYNFASGSLDYAMKDGKLYALGRNTDVMVFFYNKDMFEEYGVEVPETWDDLLAAAQVFADAGIIPVSMAGKDTWTDSHFVTAIIGQLIGSDTQASFKQAIADGDFSADYWTEACDIAAEGAKVLFGNGFETTDYATSMNNFINGGAAMWWMGSWEMSVATDFELGAFAMPDVDPDAEEALFAFPGGGYGVSANSANKDVAMDLLLYMFEPDHWSALCWEYGICMSAQDFYNYLTGEETDVQLDILDELNNATGWTGLNYKDYDSRMTTTSTGAQALLAGMISTEEYLEMMTEEAANRE